MRSGQDFWKHWVPEENDYASRRLFWNTYIACNLFPCVSAHCDTSAGMHLNPKCLRKYTKDTATTSLGSCYWTFQNLSAFWKSFAYILSKYISVKHSPGISAFLRNCKRTWADISQVYCCLFLRENGTSFGFRLSASPEIQGVCVQPVCSACHWFHKVSIYFTVLTQVN